MPIGFAKSTTGEYAGGIFWIVGAAVLFSWLVLGPVHALSGREDAAEGLRASTTTAAIRTTRPFYRKLRRWIDLAIAAPLVGHRRDRRRVWLLAVAGMKFVPQQFFPNSTRPELIVELRLKEGASFAATTEQVKQHGGGAAEGQGRPLLHRLHGRRRSRASISRSIPSCRTRATPQFVVMTQRSRGARARALAPDGRASTSSSRRRGCASRVSSSVRRSASRCSSASSGPTRRWCARSRARWSAWWPRARRCATCSSTGTTRCARCRSTSTRTRRVRSA